MSIDYSLIENYKSYPLVIRNNYYDFPDLKLKNCDIYSKFIQCRSSLWFNAPFYNSIENKIMGTRLFLYELNSLFDFIRVQNRVRNENSLKFTKTNSPSLNFCYILRNYNTHDTGIEISSMERIFYFKDDVYEKNALELPVYFISNLMNIPDTKNVLRGEFDNLKSILDPIQKDYGIETILLHALKEYEQIVCTEI